MYTDIFQEYEKNIIKLSFVVIMSIGRLYKYCVIFQSHNIIIIVNIVIRLKSE